MVNETGIKFNARDFARSLEDIGRRANSKVVSGYLVDGMPVGVGKLESYVQEHGGSEIEVVHHGI